MRVVVTTLLLHENLNFLTENTRTFVCVFNIIHYRRLINKKNIYFFTIYFDLDNYFYISNRLRVGIEI